MFTFCLEVFNMRRTFTKEERTLIKKQLIIEGRRLFQTFGYNKTSISEITKAVHIAQGTFYHFFQSKADLYMAILEKEEQKLRQQFLTFEVREDTNIKEVLQKQIKEALFYMKENKLIKDLFLKENIVAITRQFEPTIIEKHRLKDYTAMKKLIETVKTTNYTITIPPKLLTAVFHSLFLLTTFEEEIGSHIFEQTIELFVHSIIDYIVVET